MNTYGNGKKQKLHGYLKMGPNFNMDEQEILFGNMAEIIFRLRAEKTFYCLPILQQRNMWAEVFLIAVKKQGN